MVAADGILGKFCAQYPHRVPRTPRIHRTSSILLAAMLGLGSAACLASPAHTATRALPPGETVRLLASSDRGILIDIREPSDYALARVSGSLNLPGHAALHKPFLRGRDVFVLGDGCDAEACETLCEELSASGARSARFVAGGVAAWTSAGLALEGTRPVVAVEKEAGWYAVADLRDWQIADFSRELPVRTPPPRRQATVSTDAEWQSFLRALTDFESGFQGASYPVLLSGLDEMSFAARRRAIAKVAPRAAVFFLAAMPSQDAVQSVAAGAEGAGKLTIRSEHPVPAGCAACQ